MVMTSCLVLLALALCCLHGDASHITDLDVSIDVGQAQQLSDQGYTRINVDLNKGTVAGNDIYLWFKTGNSPGITGLRLTFDRSSTAPGYTKIDKDLNDGANGDYIYLWYQRGSGTPIKAISVTTNSVEEAHMLATGWEKVGGDLNRGAGGNFIYLWMKRA